MRHVSHVEWWGEYSSGCSFRLLWLRKLAKAMANTLEMHEEFISILFMKIKEIRRKGR